MSIVLTELRNYNFWEPIFITVEHPPNVSSIDVKYKDGKIEEININYKDEKEEEDNV